MRISPFKIRRRWLWLLLGLALVRGLIYAVVTPPWQAPDETGHFEYTWLIAQQGRLPSQEDVSPAFEARLIASLYEWRYGELTGRPLPAVMPGRLQDLPANVFARNSRPVLSERFSLAYLWQALFLLPVRAQDLAVQLLMVRLSAVLLSLGIVGLAFRTFCELLPARPGVAAAMTLVIILMPQHTFINSTAGDGTLAELLACLVLYCWVQIFSLGLRPVHIVTLALATLLAVLSKATALFLLPLDLALALWWLLLPQQRQFWSRQRFGYLGIGALALCFGLWVWGRAAPDAYVFQRIQAAIASSRLLLVDARGITLGQALLLTHHSFWAYFGWMALPVNPRWYAAILLLTVVAALGWLRRSQPGQEFPAWAPPMMGAAFLAAFAVYVWGQLLANGSGMYQFQGRYLFPAVIPFAFLLAGGWLKIMPAQGRGLLLAGVSFLGVFDAWCLLGYMIPFFYYR